MTLLAGKVALVTGASSGIGAATAKALSVAGARVLLSGRDVNALKSAAAQCEGETAVLPCDLMKSSDIASLAAQATQTFGSLHILQHMQWAKFRFPVNNGGIIEKGSIEDTDLDQFDRLMQVNLRSIYQLLSLCTPALKETKGSVVNISSVNGIRAFPGLIAYNVSKAALDQLTRCAALELAPYGVRVNSVNPGVVETNLHNRGYGWEEKDYAAFLERSKGTHALGRVGRPQEVAEAVVYLASSLSSFTTGASLPVDGGRHAMCPR